jgi:hypothetical protein
MLPQIYKFKELLEKGDAGLRFIVLEDREDRVFVKEVTMFNDWANSPVSVYQKTDLEVVDAEERKNWERVYDQVPREKPKLLKSMKNASGIL